MSNKYGYIMQEQVRDLIPTLMNHKLANRPGPSESRLHLISVAVVTSVYLFAMTLSG